MKNLVYFTFLLIFPLFTFSQTQSIAYPTVGKGVATTFVTDYHCLGINSSALGWGTGYEGYKKTMGMSEFAFGMFSDSLNATKLKNLFGGMRDRLVGNIPEKLDEQSRKTTVADYAEAGVSMFFDYNWAGFSFQGKRFGGIAFNIKESYQYSSTFSTKFSDLIFRGNSSSYFDSLQVAFDGDTSMIANRDNISPDSLSSVINGSRTVRLPLNLSELTNGSSIRMVWNRSYNIGYGRKIFGKDSLFVLYGGVGGRFIQSMAMFNLESDENGLRMYSSTSPSMDIDYGTVASSNPSNFVSSASGLPKAIGNGYGIDLSASVILFSKIKVAASVNNIGQVKYKRNVYSVRDTLVGSLSLPGLEDYDVTQSINNLLSSGGLLTLQGEEEYILPNASDFRLGASFQPWKFLHVGFDMVAPFNNDNPGSIQNPVYSFGGEIRPVKWLALSCGYFGGGVYQNNMPVGINFILKDGGYEIGISSRDAIAFFSNKGNTISTAFGFARVRF